jgi:cysteine-rich repeat protein
MCGDGRLDTLEECDDGNSVDTDDCRNNCTVAICGDAVVHDGEEECDDGNRSSEDACLRDCRRASCGDGWVQAGVEECDRVPPSGSSCASLGFPGGELRCTGECVVSADACDRHLGSWWYGGAVGDNFNQQLLGIATTPAGGHVVAGRYQGILDLGQNDLVSHDARSVAVLRLTRSGRLLWAQNITDGRNPRNAEQIFGDIAVDADDNTIVVGGASDWAKFGSGTDPRQVSDSTDVFVVKYAEDGAVLWIRLFGGFDRQRAEAVAVGPGGTIYVAGRWAGVLPFGDTRLTTQNALDVFVAALDQNGTPMWARTFTNAFQPHLAATPYGVVFTGYFEDEVDLGGQDLLRAPTWQQIFVAGFAEEDGATLWQAGLGGDGNTAPTGLAVLRGGDLIVSGSHVGAGRARSLYFARINEDEVLWERRFRSNAVRVLAPASVQAALPDGFVSAGHFDTGLTIGSIRLEGRGGVDGFAAGFGPDGDPRWATVLGNRVDQYVMDMAVDADGDLRIAGTFEYSVDFGGGPLHSNGRLDSYVLHLFGGGQP